MPTPFYPSTLTDMECEKIQPLLPSKKFRGLHREVDLKQVLNAIFYRADNGIKWQAMAMDFSTWQTVYEYFRVGRLCPSSPGCPPRFLPVEFFHGASALMAGRMTGVLINWMSFVGFALKGSLFSLVVPLSLAPVAPEAPPASSPIA